MNKKERLLFALGDIDDKYIKEAEARPMAQRNRIIAVAASLALVVALSLYLFIPFASPVSQLREYEGSAYFPLIEKLDAYRLSINPIRYKNNFDKLVAGIGGGLFAPKNDAAPEAPDMEAMPDGMVGSNGSASNDPIYTSPGPGSNGSYVENTDNQVEGVIEGDLMKMTDKYIFRLGYDTENSSYYKLRLHLSVYSIEGDDSHMVSRVQIPPFDDENRCSYTDCDMYLSSDGGSITLVKEYTANGRSRVGIISLDVSDVNNITEKGRITIDGSMNTTRLVDGKLLLVSEFYFNSKDVDYNDPGTFVPCINRGEGDEPILFEDIICPDEIGHTRYSVVALLDTENLELLGAKALLNFTNTVYVSENNLYITREYVSRVESEENKNEYESSNVSDVCIIGYRGGELTEKQILTVRGWTEDQYSFDEKDGHLRVVTSTTDTRSKQSEEYSFQYTLQTKRSASLYVFNLDSGEMVASVVDFAPEGEEATAVRFEDEFCYVCTAEVVTFTDPVFFFDLSDYENITYTDTGIIEGYSDHLIDLGDGFLLGIGRENSRYNKIDIYESRDGAVVSVDKYLFNGSYSLDYKSYLVNREENLFGFASHLYDNEYDVKKAYVLIHFDGYEVAASVFDLGDTHFNPETVRSIYLDGYLYITTHEELVVKALQ